MASIDKTKILSEYNLSRAFTSIDRFGTGVLSFKELKYCFGLDVSEEIWRKLIGQLELENDIQVHRFQTISDQKEGLH